MQKSPILETIFGFFEKDLSPIILELPFILKSKTGDVLIFTPIDKSVGAYSLGEPDNNKTWTLSFKWKPPEFNTIDFLVKTKKLEMLGVCLVVKLRFILASCPFLKMKTA